MILMEMIDDNDKIVISRNRSSNTNCFLNAIKTLVPQNTV